MSGQPLDLAELEAQIAHELRACAPAQRDWFSRIRIQPERWELKPWGDEGGGFWVVAICGRHAIWYNDIEEGFEVSSFEQRGSFLPQAYGCNQDELRLALLRLAEAARHLAPGTE